MKDFLLPLLMLLVGGWLVGSPPAPSRASYAGLPEARARVALDTPQPQGGQDSTRKRAEKCICPPVVPDYTPEQVVAEFGNLRYDTLAVNPGITSTDKLQEKILREKDRRERRLAKLRDRANYVAMRGRLRDLDSLRLRACCLVVYLEREMVEPAHPEMQKRRKIQVTIGKNWGLLNTDLQIVEEERGAEAAKDMRRLETTFRSLADTTALAQLDQPETKQMVNNLKESIFFSRLSPNVNCKGGVGNLLKGLPANAWGDLKPTEGCVGYTVSLGRTYNLIIVKLTNGNTIAIIWDKTTEGHFGAVKLI
jgi:hypothetical protein